MFKVGDKVKTTENALKEKIGTIVEIWGNKDGATVKFENWNNGWGEDNSCWNCMFEDLEKITTNFTKSDLKDGDIVTYRNGCIRTIKQNKLLDEDNFEINNLDNFKKTLECKETKNYDIIKVERPLGYETVFERKEEILDEAEKRYLRDVIRPFRKNIEAIDKREKCNNKKLSYVSLYLTNDDITCLPFFETGSMYKSMEADRKYTLEELGL